MEREHLESVLCRRCGDRVSLGFGAFCERCNALIVKSHLSRFKYALLLLGLIWGHSSTHQWVVDGQLSPKPFPVNEILLLFHAWDFRRLVAIEFLTFVTGAIPGFVVAWFVYKVLQSTGLSHILLRKLRELVYLCLDNWVKLLGRFGKG